MATVTKGKTFISGETVEPADMHQLVDSATVTNIVNADIASNAAIAASKLALTGAITDTQLATGAVTGAAGGGKIAASAITGQTQKASIADADELLVHSDSDSALRRVAWSAMQPPGSVLQTVYAEDATYRTATGKIPFDDTLPTSTEGTEILSVAITPESDSNKILVRSCIPLTTMSTARGAAWALFRGTTCIQFAVGNMYVNANTTDSPVYLEVLDSPNSASSQTYSLRVGPAFAADTVRLNGDAARKYGGACKITMTLQEIKG